MEARNLLQVEYMIKNHPRNYLTIVPENRKYRDLHIKEKLQR